MLSNTTNNASKNLPSRSQRRGTVRRRTATLAAAVVIAATPMAARAVAPPPVPITVAASPDTAVDAAVRASEFSTGRAGATVPPHLRKRAAPIAPIVAMTKGAAVPVPVRAGPAGGGAHIVRAGETLWAVAAAYARSGEPRAVREAYDAFLRANRARFSAGHPDLIFPGERLRIPSPYVSRHE